MITYVVGDLFQSPARVLVNTVNTVGVMGKGIAKDFKTIFPEMFKQYQTLCERNAFDIGQLWLYKTPHKWILNFPTKKHWRQPSRLEYIEAGLKKFAASYVDLGITSIAFPMLGCGNGELKWEEVRPLMEKYLNNLPIDVYVYLYDKTWNKAEHKNVEEIKQWLRGEPQSLAFSELWEDVQCLLSKKNEFVTLNSEKPFEAHCLDSESPGILIIDGSDKYVIEHEQLVSLWQHVRSLGFCMESSLPNELDDYAEYLIAILRELPYLKPVLINTCYKQLDHNSIGLQYVPPISDEWFSMMHEVTSR
ncbi:MAG TPA: macro domain-containing protein [Syntrophomonadaceae bacterium]|nr:macro domain-containing protein [Syntrophomonadaceae bacterium]HPU49306.1 macro domain-containing protein [Syntrophomonadaceae bacterium]HQD90776.1 macro domain-containing protein [Syntrophomonadaceae bacterium]